MLNQLPYRSFPASGPQTAPRIHTEIPRREWNADWCVGDAPSRWDISFTDRLMLTLRRWFSRGSATVPLKLNPSEVAAKRKAA
jgi:hypothetical protein